MRTTTIPKWGKLKNTCDQGGVGIDFCIFDCLIIECKGTYFLERQNIILKFMFLVRSDRIKWNCVKRCLPRVCG